MFTQKDRKIANQRVMIQNRDKLIGRQRDKIAKLESKLRQIEIFASMNNYSHPEVYLRKIKELTEMGSIR